jgi:hypothetical protein
VARHVAWTCLTPPADARNVVPAEEVAMGWAIAALVIVTALIVGWLVDRRHEGSNRSPADIATGVERRWRLPGAW